MQIAITSRASARASRTGSGGRWGRGARASEMEKLHAALRRRLPRHQRPDRRAGRGAVPPVAAFASFGFAKSHAAAFARTAYESAFLKLFYPAQFTVGLINAQPMGFYPVEVLINDAKRHGVAVLPVDVNASSYKTTTEWVGPGRQAAVRRSSGCIVPSAASRERWTPERRPATASGSAWRW
jgi:error-prone DNA polymerase